MNKEIEQLIELTLIDGQLTEKERAVIINKAMSLGMDQDEIEVIIEGKIQQIQAENFKSNKEKIGNIKTCPACGSPIKSMTGSCENCEHEFTNVEANKSITQLLNKINSIQKFKDEEDSDFQQRKASQINNTPIPNSKEDLIEFLTVCTTQADVDWMKRRERNVDSASTYKGKEALLKAKILFREDVKSMMLIDAYEKKLINARKKANYIWFILLGIGVVYGIVWLFDKFYK